MTVCSECHAEFAMDNEIRDVDLSDVVLGLGNNLGYDGNIHAQGFRRSWDYLCPNCLEAIAIKVSTFLDKEWPNRE